MAPVRFENIQALRGVAVLLVVLCYLQVIEQKYSHGKIFLPDWLSYAMASVDLFLLSVVLLLLRLRVVSFSL
jgi:hypothetical protein